MRVGAVLLFECRALGEMLRSTRMCACDPMASGTRGLREISGKNVAGTPAVHYKKYTGLYLTQASLL